MSLLAISQISFIQINKVNVLKYLNDTCILYFVNLQNQAEIKKSGGASSNEKFLEN